MSSSLVSSIKRFCKHSKRLEKILEDTKRCFDDINEKGQAENGQRLVSADILKEEEQEIHNLTHNYPGIVVLGQNTYCKSRVVNEILSRSIFPNVDGEDNLKRCRTVRFKYGDNLCLNLELPGNYSLAEDLEAYNRNWNTIPLKDLLISDFDANDSASCLALLEVAFNHQLLRYGCTLMVSASRVPFEEEITRCIENVSPILVYAFQTDILETSDIQELEVLKQLSHFQPVCFVKVPPPVVNLPEQALLAAPDGQSSHGTSSHQSTEDSENLNTITEEKLNLNVDNSPAAPDQHVIPGSKGATCSVSSSTTARRRDMSPDCSSSSSPSPSPSPTHQRQGKVIVPSLPPPQCQAVFEQLCKLGYFSATPGVRNISRDIEDDYFQVDSVFVSEFDQLVPVFTTFSEQTMQRYLVNAVTVLNNIHIRCLNTFIVHAFDMARDILITPKKLDFARDKEDELYKSLLQIAVAKGDEIREMIELTVKDNRDLLIEKANDYDFIGVDFGNRGEILTPKGLKICTGQIQELVLGGLNQAVAGQLVNSVDILRDSYTGTLTRCLESLELIEQENPDNNSTTEALKQILNAAYQVEINVRSSSTFLHFLLERMKQIVQSMPWNQAPKIDDEWKKKVATEMLYSLSATRLAKSISAQIKDRLNKSHDAFSQSLRQLEVKHCGRLDKIEEDRLKLRKVHAPRVAKVALESTSLKDVILHGMPQMGREIGRGQYGVVYSCDKWAGFSPCAIKSVVPPDDKHWNDLALEFFYTKFIPDHERIVMLKGSVIDYNYGGGTTPAVLLVMDRLQRDLYTAIKQQLDWVSRLQVSIDVVEGIRYLHNQGLVHRDIKLKNVLLDKQNRARITDLGFCKPEAMMSYSIVGTPIHMAPELFSGHYDNSVDVFAFGILFWYICAGSVKLPQAFEQCANKDQLWNNVKKGLRPEQLPVFDDECWELMSNCWEGKPASRPLLGDVQQRLVGIYERYRNKPGGPLRTAVESPPRGKSPLNQPLKQKAK